MIAALLETLGLSEDSVHDDLKAAVNAYYTDVYPDPANGQNAEAAQQYQQAIKDSLSDDNLDAAVFFVKDSSLYAAAVIYTIAGAGYVNAQLCVTGL